MGMNVILVNIVFPLVTSVIVESTKTEKFKLMVVTLVQILKKLKGLKNEEV